jgi:hypothetical protein
MCAVVLGGFAILSSVSRVQAMEPPPPIEYNLTVAVEGGGSVTPSLNPAGGTSPATPSWTETYASGTSVTLTATATDGWVFDHWTGALSGNANPASVTMDAAKSVTAVFLPTVSWSGGSGRIEFMTTACMYLHRPSAPYTTTVNYTVTPGTATGGGVDYTCASGQVTFAPNQTQISIPLGIIDDALDENDETFTMSIASVINGVGVSTPHAPINYPIIISDDDPPSAKFQSAASTVGESVGSVTVPVVLSTRKTWQVTVYYTVSGGGTFPATSGEDFSPTSGSLVFALYQTSGTISVPILNDTLDENDETVVVSITSVVGGTLGSPATHTLTIADDDPLPVVRFFFDQVTGWEDWGTASVSVSTDCNSGKTVTVEYYIKGGTAVAGTDYTPVSGTVTLQNSEWWPSASFDIPLINDSTKEGDKTIILGIRNPVNATLGTTFQECVVNLRDDDSLPRVHFEAAATMLQEAATTAEIPVVLSEASSTTVWVSYADAGTGTATGGNVDYGLTAGWVYFQPGETRKTIPVTIMQDSLNENDETLAINLAYPGESRLSTPSTHVVTICSAVPRPSVQWASAGVPVAESAGTVSIPWTLSAASGSTVTVPYTVTGTATGGGVDHTLANGTLTIPPWHATGNLAVSLVNDTLDEADETVVVTFGSPSNATLGTPSAYTLTVADDDPLPAVQWAAAGASVAESAGTVNLPWTLSAASGRSVTVPYTVTGTATGGGVDYILANGTLTIAAGQTDGNLAVSLVNDTLDEADETIVVTFGTPGNATLGTPGAYALTVTDNDYILTVHPSPCGTVAATPSGGVYEAGTSVSLAVTANPGWVFSNWTQALDGSTANPVTLVMDGNKEVTPVFEALRTLTVHAVAEQGSISPNGGTFVDGESVQLTATAAQGWRFDHWEGVTEWVSEPARSANPSNSLVMNDNKEVTACFVPTFTLETSFSPEDGGSVSVSPVLPVYDNGAVVTLTATPNAGYCFSHWNDDLANTQSSIEVTMDANKSFTAVFARPHTLSVTVEGNGSVSPASGTYPGDLPRTLTATADTGWHFDRWEGMLSGTDNPVTIPMTLDKSINAVFVQDLQAVIEVNEEEWYTQEKQTRYGNASLTQFFAPLPVFFEGWKSTPRADIVDWEWNFGDGSPVFHGFNAAHIYDPPDGDAHTYTATLTVMTRDGQTATTTQTIQVLQRPSGATTYYVDSALGNDNNDGTTEASAWKTATKAFGGMNGVNGQPFYKPGDQILFRRGQEFDFAAGVVRPDPGTMGYGYCFGAFGTGAKPVINHVGTSQLEMIFLDARCPYLAFWGLKDLEFNCRSGEGAVSSFFITKARSCNLFFLRCDIHDHHQAIGINGNHTDRRISNVYVIDCSVHDSHLTDGMHLYTKASRYANINSTFDMCEDHVGYHSYLNKAVFSQNTYTRWASGRLAIRVCGVASATTPTNNVHILNNRFIGWKDPVHDTWSHTGTGYNKVAIELGPNVQEQQWMNDALVEKNQFFNLETFIEVGVWENVTIRNNYMQSETDDTSNTSGSCRIAIGHKFELKPVKNVSIYGNTIVSDEYDRDAQAAVFYVGYYGAPAYQGRTFHEGVCIVNNHVSITKSDARLLYMGAQSRLQRAEVVTNGNAIYFPFPPTLQPDKIIQLGGTYNQSNPPALLYSLDEWRNLAGHDLATVMISAATKPVAGTAESPAWTDATPIPVHYKGARAVGNPLNYMPDQPDPILPSLVNVHLWVKKDNGAWTDTGLTSPAAEGTFLYGNTSGNGHYSFAVQAEDSDGNSSPPPTGAGHTTTTFWQGGTADITPPEVATINYASATGSGSNPIVIAFDHPYDSESGVKTVHLWVSKGGGAWTNTGLTCPAYWGVFSWVCTTGTASYEFALQSEDYAGNLSAQPTVAGYATPTAYTQ